MDSQVTQVDVPWVSSIGNRNPAFHTRAPLITGTDQPSTSGADHIVTPAVTAVTNIPATQVGARSTPATTITSPPCTSAPIRTTRVPPRMRCQTAAPENARLRVNWSATSQAMVHLFEVINVVTKELQEEKDSKGS